MSTFEWRNGLKGSTLHSQAFNFSSVESPGYISRDNFHSHSSQRYQPSISNWPLLQACIKKNKHITGKQVLRELFHFHERDLMGKEIQSLISVWSLACKYYDEPFTKFARDYAKIVRPPQKIQRINSWVGNVHGESLDFQNDENEFVSEIAQQNKDPVRYGQMSASREPMRQTSGSTTMLNIPPMESHFSHDFSQDFAKESRAAKESRVDVSRENKIHENTMKNNETIMTASEMFIEKKPKNSLKEYSTIGTNTIANFGIHVGVNTSNNEITHEKQVNIISQAIITLVLHTDKPEIRALIQQELHSLESRGKIALAIQNQIKDIPMIGGRAKIPFEFSEVFGKLFSITLSLPNDEIFPNHWKFVQDTTFTISFSDKHSDAAEWDLEELIMRISSENKKNHNVNKYIKDCNDQGIDTIDDLFELDDWKDFKFGPLMQKSLRFWKLKKNTPSLGEVQIHIKKYVFVIKNYIIYHAGDKINSFIDNEITYNAIRHLNRDDSISKEALKNVNMHFFKPISYDMQYAPKSLLMHGEDGNLPLEIAMQLIELLGAVIVNHPFDQIAEMARCFPYRLIAVVQQHVDAREDLKVLQDLAMIKQFPNVLFIGTARSMKSTSDRIWESFHVKLHVPCIPARERWKFFRNFLKQNGNLSIEIKDKDAILSLTLEMTSKYLGLIIGKVAITCKENGLHTVTYQNFANAILQLNQTGSHVHAIDHLRIAKMFKRLPDEIIELNISLQPNEEYRTIAMINTSCQPTIMRFQPSNEEPRPMVDINQSFISSTHNMNLPANELNHIIPILTRFCIQQNIETIRTLSYEFIQEFDTPSEIINAISDLIKTDYSRIMIIIELDKLVQIQQRDQIEPIRVWNHLIFMLNSMSSVEKSGSSKLESRIWFTVITGNFNLERILEREISFPYSFASFEFEKRRQSLLRSMDKSFQKSPSGDRMRTQHKKNELIV